MMTSALEAAASVDQGIDDEEHEEQRARARSTHADAHDHLVVAPLLIGCLSSPATCNRGGRRWCTAAKRPGAKGRGRRGSRGPGAHPEHDGAVSGGGGGQTAS